MTIAEKVYKHLVKMTEQNQKEVLDFVEFLDAKERNNVSVISDSHWQTFSLVNALRGMGKEELHYSVNDLKKVFS